MDDDTLDNIISQMPNVDKTKLKNILKLDEDKDLAMLEELQSINEGIKMMCEKEMPTMEMPEPLEEVSIKNLPDVMKVEITNPMPMPEMPKMDMTETNNLLKRLLAKETEPKDVEISVTLKLE